MFIFREASSDMQEKLTEQMSEKIKCPEQEWNLRHPDYRDRCSNRGVVGSIPARGIRLFPTFVLLVSMAYERVDSIIHWISYYSRDGI